MEKENKRHTGNMGESVACDYLERCGYRIIERNYYCPYGEIDIIAQDERHTAFIEVKTRADSKAQSKYGRPANAVNYTKRQHMIKSVQNYLKENKAEKSPRFDVIEILYSKIEGSDFYQFKIKHTRAAFDVNGESR